MLLPPSPNCLLAEVHPQNFVIWGSPTQQALANIHAKSLHHPRQILLLTGPSSCNKDLLLPPITGALSEGWRRGMLPFSKPQSPGRSSKGAERASCLPGVCYLNSDFSNFPRTLVEGFKKAREGKWPEPQIPLGLREGRFLYPYHLPLEKCSDLTSPTS